MNKNFFGFPNLSNFAQSCIGIFIVLVGIKVVTAKDANFAIANSQFELSNSKLAIAKEANRVQDQSRKLESLTEKLKLEQANNKKCLDQYVELENEFIKLETTNPTELKHFSPTVPQDLKQDLESIENELRESEEELSETIDDLTNL